MKYLIIGISLAVVLTGCDPSSQQEYGASGLSAVSVNSETPSVAIAPITTPSHVPSHIPGTFVPPVQTVYDPFDPNSMKMILVRFDNTDTTEILYLNLMTLYSYDTPQNADFIYMNNDGVSTACRSNNLSIAQVTAKETVTVRDTNGENVSYEKETNIHKLSISQITQAVNPNIRYGVSILPFFTANSWTDSVTSPCQKFAGEWNLEIKPYNVTYHRMSK